MYEVYAEVFSMLDRSIELQLEAGVIMMPHWNYFDDRHDPDAKVWLRDAEQLLNHSNPHVQFQAIQLMDSYHFPVELLDTVFCIMDRFVWKYPVHECRMYALRRACSVAPRSRIPDMARSLELPQDLLAVPLRVLGYCLDENSPPEIATWTKKRIGHHVISTKRDIDEDVIIWYCIVMLYAMMDRERFQYYDMVVDKHGPHYRWKLDQLIAEAL